MLYVIQHRLSRLTSDSKYVFLHMNLELVSINEKVCNRFLLKKNITMNIC